MGVVYYRVASPRPPENSVLWSRAAWAGTFTGRIFKATMVPLELDADRNGHLSWWTLNEFATALSLPALSLPGSAAKSWHLNRNDG